MDDSMPIIGAIKGVLRRSGAIDRQPFRGFLRDVNGVIHIGAHTGQERHIYSQYRLKVLWVEAIPEIFKILQQNIAGLSDQRAMCSLVTDKDAATYKFHVTSNEGASSSVFSLDLHKDVWPEVKETSVLSMTSTTLSSLLDAENIRPDHYDALVMDTQGSELLVLKGIGSNMRHFKYIKTEVADFAAYRDGCQHADIDAFLLDQGFVEYARKEIAQHAAGGAYYDIVYRRE